MCEQEDFYQCFREKAKYVWTKKQPKIPGAEKYECEMCKKRFTSIQLFIIHIWWGIFFYSIGVSIGKPVVLVNWSHISKESAADLWPTDCPVSLQISFISLPVLSRSWSVIVGLSQRFQTEGRVFVNNRNTYRVSERENQECVNKKIFINVSERRQKIYEQRNNLRFLEQKTKWMWNVWGNVPKHPVVPSSTFVEGFFFIIPQGCL